MFFVLFQSNEGQIMLLIKPEPMRDRCFFVPSSIFWSKGYREALLLMTGIFY